MPNNQTEDWGQIVSPESDIQKLPERTVVVEKALPAYLTALGADAKVPQFRYRVLIAEDEPTIRETARKFWKVWAMKFSQHETDWMACTPSASRCLM